MSYSKQFKHLKGVLSCPAAARAVVGLVVISAALLYSPTITDPFFKDDINLVHGGSSYRIERANPFSRYDMLYRPAWEAYAALAHPLFGLNHSAYHLANITLHLLNTVLVFFLARRVLKTPMRAALASALFALFSKITEAVHWISASSTLLVALFMLATVLLFLRYLDKPGLLRLSLAVLTFTIALLTKETAVTLVLLLWVAAVYAHRESNGLKDLFVLKGRWQPLVPMAAISSIYCLTYLFRFRHNWLVTGGSYKLSPDIFINFLEITTDLLFNSTHWYTYCLLAVVAAFTLLRADSRWKFGFFWLLISTIPFLPLQGEGLYERFNYVPLAGASIFILAMFGSLYDLLKESRLPATRAILPLALVLVLIGSAFTVQSHIAERSSRHREFYRELAAIESALGALGEGQEIEIDTGLYPPYVEQYIKLKRGLRNINVVTPFSDRN